MNYKRGASPQESVQFYNGSSVVELPAGATGKFAIKPFGKYDSEPLAFAESWTKVGSGSETYYRFDLSFATAAINQLLSAFDENQNNDKSSIQAMAEIQWIIDGKVYKSQTVPVTIENDIVRDEDGTPLENPTPLNWLIENLTQTRIQNAIPQDAAFRASIGAISTEDLFNIYRYQNTDSGNLIVEGITNGAQCEISFTVAEYNSYILLNINGSMSIDDPLSIPSGEYPRYFQLVIDASADLSDTSSQSVTFSNGLIPLLFSPSIDPLIQGNVTYNAISNLSYAKAGQYLTIYNSGGGNNDVLTVSSGQGSVTEINNTNASEIIVERGSLVVNNAPNLASIPNATNIPYIDLNGCALFAQSLPGAPSSGEDTAARYIINTALVEFSATGRFGTLVLGNNSGLGTIDLSGVTHMGSLTVYMNDMGNSEIDAMFASIADVNAFADGTIITGVNWTSASDSIIAALNAVNCTVIYD